MQITFKPLILFLIFIFLVGCQTSFETSEAASEITPEIGITPPPVSQKLGGTVTPPTPDITGLESLIDMAKNDLAKRLSISVDKIDLVEAKPVVWPDSSIGCPQPDMAYLQIPEDGALIILQFNGISYEYHNGGSRGLFLCENIYKDPAITPNLDLFNLTPSKSDPPPTTPDNSIPPGEDT